MLMYVLPLPTETEAASVLGGCKFSLIVSLSSSYTLYLPSAISVPTQDIAFFLHAKFADHVICVASRIYIM